MCKTKEEMNGQVHSHTHEVAVSDAHVIVVACLVSTAAVRA